MNPLVIGIGNPNRGDDAVGVLVVRALTGLRTRELADCSGMLDLWEEEDHVIVVDAMISGERPGTVRRFEAGQESLPTRSFSSTHSFGLSETVEVGRALARLPNRLTIYGIEADRFDHGGRVSPAVRDAMNDVVTAIQREAD
jgi:hydrogenase maturation protease